MHKTPATVTTLIIFEGFILILIFHSFCNGLLAYLKYKWLRSIGVTKDELCMIFSNRENFKLDSFLKKYGDRRTMKCDALTRKIPHILKLFFSLATVMFFPVPDNFLKL